MSRIVCVGETLIDFVAERDASDIGASERFLRAAGGAVSNVAIGIARLGGDVAFVGSIGDDPFGAFLRRTLGAEGVDVAGVRVVRAPTALVFVSRGQDGSRDFFPVDCPGAESYLAPEHLDRTALSEAACLHFGGVMLAAEPGRSACLTAAAIAGKTGLVTFDLNARPRIFGDRDRMRATLLEGCAAAHLVKCSEEDLEALGLRDHGPADLLNGETRAAVITHGKRGCTWATKSGTRGSAAPPAITPVDTTGAGDAFMAALLWRLCGHHGGALGAEEMEESVRWAVVAGALACAEEGAIASLPRAADLTALVEPVR